MYIKKCKYCGKKFKSTQPNAEYCSKYHGGKARTERRKLKKDKEIKINEHMCIVSFLAFAHEQNFIDTSTKVNLMKNIQIHLKEKELMRKKLDDPNVKLLINQLKI